MALAGNGVLVRLDGMRGEQAGGGMALALAVDRLDERYHVRLVGVNGRYNREVVLELVEVVFGRGRQGNRAVERILERWEVGAEGQFANNVGEVES